MPDEKQISRRTALKVIAVGVGTASAIPLLEDTVAGQHSHSGMAMNQATTKQEESSFFNEDEFATVSLISSLIIPPDRHSEGTSVAGVPEFIDLMIKESSKEVQTLWRDGLAAINRMSLQRFSVSFIAATDSQQIELLKVISRNEYRPRAIEERFFVAIKGLTVDGYYTSEIGIHQELRYKGNTYLKDFIGCTHPEHIR